MAISDQLASWARCNLPPQVSVAGDLVLSPITGDAGFREYFRLNTDPSLMAVHAPPAHEDVPAFVSKDLAMGAGGVGVPRVYAVDYGRGFMLQEDLGGQLMLPLLDDSSIADLYGAAEAELAKIQALPADPAVFGPYDAAQLTREMALFPEWFASELLGLSLGPADRRVIDDTFALLCEAALAQPQVVVHRDYHSRNLLVAADGGLGVVDFQDALIGPFSYDLVSLLKDCYIRWPVEVVKSRAVAFLSARLAASGSASPGQAQLVRWFDWMGLQRHLKVLGIFARLWLRDGKARYLDDLPLVLRYTLEVTSAYPELRAIDNWFNDRILPALPDQPWYRDWRTAGD